ncbi:MAG: polymer-forming cytoskeletal protein [Gemmatimonadetes bacterium]|jgi:cytoskeletal protein CcmA (bactofilin family)|nr:polymer-forming cytoskeletal protein [Gemmatimonadota bacterium]
MAIGNSKNKGTESSITVIGQGTLLDGTFELEHGLRVEGILRGKRLSTREVLMVEGGEVTSETIEVGEAVIDGTVVGSLTAQRKVHMAAGARFRGQLVTPRLVLEAGAEMVEDRSVGPAKKSKEKEDAG